MIEFINRIDTSFFLFLNSINNPFWDTIMWHISETIPWLPLYGIILFFIFKKMKWYGFITFLILILLILIADQGSVILFKNVFQRLRPCHQAEISDIVHTVNGKCGGQFGFVSSHAANTFAFAMFVALFFKKRYFSIFIFFWASLVSYSRIYLGVHFPLDILGGALFGMFIGYTLFLFHQFLFERYLKEKKPD